MPILEIGQQSDGRKEINFSGRFFFFHDQYAGLGLDCDNFILPFFVDIKYISFLFTFLNNLN